MTAPQMIYLRAMADELGVSVGEVIRKIVDDHRSATDDAREKAKRAESS